MTLESRPYIGTFKLDSREFVQVTPDALLYINGSTSIPGCSKCNTRIDLKKYITEISVEAGVDPGGTSASFSLSLPVSVLDPSERNAETLIRKGSEVTIYMRGYFPVKGLYDQFNEYVKQDQIKVNTLVGENISNVNSRYNSSDFISSKENITDQDTLNNLTHLAADFEVIHQYLEQLGKSGVIPDYKGPVSIQINDGYAEEGHVEGSEHYEGNAADFTARYRSSDGKTQDVPRGIVWAALKKLRDAKKIEKGAIGAYVKLDENGKALDEWFSPPHYDRRGRNTDYVWNKTVGGEDLQKNTSYPEGYDVLVKGLPKPTVDSYTSFIQKEVVINNNQNNLTTQNQIQSSLNLENVLAYPYYKIFRGVITNTSGSYSGGQFTMSVTCASLLHFWEYHKIATNASVFGPRPKNSKLKTSLVGHNFTGMHPYEIIYYIHNEMVGSPGGVYFSLVSQNNNDAIDTLSGESYFSLVGKYWERRFSSDPPRLRLHGASGSLFSSAQAAFLSKTSGPKLMSLVKNRFADPDAKRQENNNLLQSSYALGLFKDKKLSELLVKQGGGKGNFDLNLAEMHAFVSNLSNWGQVNFFESAYESKIDIVRKVCEVTGFEFYQDVDGDFVFKPPMYNLDTSSSRIYRLEDIDIINISFTEEEPQATYARGKGSHFQNLQGHGVENEWGVEGTYVDYRLVAQYGWRPEEFETAYYTNRTAIFYAGMNKVDLKNAQSSKASVTIPYRPEIRPGYPVYLVREDCFYYCHAVSHSISFGGECTTTLQMYGKRPKFLAPGVLEGASGIDAINMKDITLPEKPLRVLNQDGSLSVSGFPNVVMALDPFQLNPLFLLFGNDFEDISDPFVLRNLLKAAFEKKILQKTKDGDYILSREDGKKTIFLLDSTNLAKKTKDLQSAQGQDIDVLDVTKAAKYYVKQQESKIKEKEALQKEIQKLQNEINQKQGALRNLIKQAEEKNVNNQSKIEELSKDISSLEQQKSKKQEQNYSLSKSFEQSLSNENKEGVKFLLDLIRLFAKEQWVPLKDENIKNVQAHHLLDMLSDKKALMDNSKIPGSFRYYSASHYDPDQQGQPLIEFVYGEDGSKETKVSNANIDDSIIPTEIKTFVPPVLPYAGAPLADVSVEDRVPVRGIRVLTTNPLFPNGQVLPTSEIREFKFGAFDLTLPKDVLGTDDKPVILEIPQDVIKDIQSFFSTKGNDLSGATTIKNYFIKQWDVLNERISKSFESMQKEANRFASFVVIPPMPIIDFPIISLGYGTSYDFDSTYRYKNNNAPQNPNRSLAGQTKETIFKKIGEDLGKVFSIQIKSNVLQWQGQVKSLSGIEDFDKYQIISRFISIFSQTFGKAVSSKKGKASKKETKKHKIEAPIFPVSDAKGYKVIGSYRYGRDISIEVGGGWDSLRNMDPLSVLDRDTLEKLVDEVTRSKGSLSQELEKKVLDSLRQKYTDKQLLDIGIYQITDGNQLEYSLSNWFANNKEGIGKLPITNAATSLADLQMSLDSNVCDCKIQQTGVLLESLASSDFVYVDKNANDLNQFQQTQAQLRAPAWRQRQEALRGSSQSPAYRTFIESTQALVGAPDAAQRALDNALSAFQNIGENE